MADAHKNFAYSTVATAPSPATSGTSLVVAAGQGALFPAAPFNATIWPVSAQPTAANAEIVRVTNISTDTLTITRTQESTSARTVVVGDQIAATVTAKTLTDVETALLTDPVTIGHGGTGQTTQAAALDAIAGATTANKVLRGDGSHVTLDSLVAADIPNLDAAKLTTGTMATARLGSGTADATTVLAGDQTYRRRIRSLGNFGASGLIGSIATSASLLGGAQTGLIPALSAGDIIRTRFSGNLQNNSGGAAVMYFQIVIGAMTYIATLSTLSIASSATSIRQVVGDVDFYCPNIGSGTQTVFPRQSSDSSAANALLWVVANSTLSQTAVSGWATNAAVNFDFQVHSDVNAPSASGTLQMLSVEHVAVG